MAWASNVASILTFLTCKGVLIVAALFPLVNFTNALDQDLQAAVISVFALLTLGLIFRNYRACHHVVAPVVMAAFGTILVVGSMYIMYNSIVESVGLVVLMSSAIWNWWSIRSI